MKRIALFLLLVLVSPAAMAQQWAAVWTGSAQGPYPVGNPTAQPELKFAFPSPEQGANDQTFRLVVKPDAWGQQVRIRMSNAFGTKPVTFERCLRRPAGERRGDRRRHQQAAHVPEQEERHRGAGREHRQRSGGALLRQAGRCNAEGSQARDQLPRCGPKRPDDLARPRRCRRRTSARPAAAPRARTRARARSPSRPPPGTSSTRVDMPGLAKPAKVIVAFGDFDHRRHRHDHQRRRPLARRAVAPPARRAYGDGLRRGQPGHRRQPGGRARRLRHQAHPPAAPVRSAASSATSFACQPWHRCSGSRASTTLGAADATAETVIEAYKKGVAYLRQKIPGVKIYGAHAHLGAEQHADPRAGPKSTPSARP